MRTAVAQTSIDAFYGLGPRLGEQQRAIVAFLARNCSHDWTRNEIAQATGMRLSSVCARCNELIRVQILHESPRRPCRCTGVAAHPLMLSGGQGELGLAA